MFGSVGGGPSVRTHPSSSSTITFFFPVTGSMKGTFSGRGTGNPVLMSIPV